jgi:hypothetical protein
MTKYAGIWALILTATASGISAVAGWLLAPTLFDLALPERERGFALAGDTSARVLVAVLAFGFAALGTGKMAHEMFRPGSLLKPEDAGDAKPIDTAMRAAERVRRR